jgi:putative hydrolase of the HAD superfamily
MAENEMTRMDKVPRYSCIFFDLDHTLWDYEENSKHTLIELYEQYHLRAKGVDSQEEFTTQFRIINTQLWDLFDRGVIKSEVIRQQRFKKILGHFSIVDEKLCEDLSHDYLIECPKKGHLIPHALSVLEYLAPKYSMSVITNGFEEIQNLKLESSKLLPYFDHIVTSQRAGSRKPSCEIFNFALQCHDIKCHQALMVGDNLLTDIGGACNAYIDAVFFNPEKITHDGHSAHEIHCLSELRTIL